MPIGVPLDMYTGSRFKTNNCGVIEVVNYHSAKNVEVRFCDTGFIRSASTSHIRLGKVKDRTRPAVHGVGFLGIGKHGAKSSELAYRRWVDMLKRCYSERSLKKYPTYKDCTVCEGWHNFQNFAEWFYENYKEGFDLDKDIASSGGKEYSPENCRFVKHSDNMVKAHAKSFKVLDPTGNVIEFYNLRQFCRDNNLESGTMCNVINGKVNQYKGWKRFIEIEVEV